MQNLHQLSLTNFNDTSSFTFLFMRIYDSNSILSQIYKELA